jgi:hypothetical protein
MKDKQEGIIFVAGRELPKDSAAPFAVIPADQDVLRNLRKRLNQLRYAKARISITKPGRAPETAAYLSWGIKQEQAVALGRECAQDSILWLEGSNIYRIRCSDGSQEILGSWDGQIFNRATRPTHCIYVVRLSSEVLKEKDFMKTNPGAQDAKDPLYVGMTGTSWEERFAQHKRGYKASRIVRKYGQELVPELCLPYMPHSVAKPREATYATELRASGYAVWQN